eukprot:15458840-Alexandrium_andersonii.AAC.1
MQACAIKELVSHLWGQEGTDATTQGGTERGGSGCSGRTLTHRGHSTSIDAARRRSSPRGDPGEAFAPEGPGLTRM